MTNRTTYQLKKVNDTEVDVEIFGEKFRVCIMNRSHSDAKLAIAYPHGDNYSLAYKWQFSWPVAYGPERILKVLEEPRMSMSWVRSSNYVLHEMTKMLTKVRDILLAEAKAQGYKVRYSAAKEW